MQRLLFHTCVLLLRRTVLMCICLCSCTLVLPANDGAFRAAGAQLIPLQQDSIHVRAEKLSISRKTKDEVYVDVEYSFEHRGVDRDVLVGFEAAAPSGDTDGRPVNGQHPNIREFTVDMNGNNIPWRVAFVDDSLYVTNDKVQGIDPKKVSDTSSWEVDYRYVYYFKAHFKHGLNTIKHHYVCALSGSIDRSYSFNYILSAASRWEGGVIDDFELTISMGDFESFVIDTTFFARASQWTSQGKAKIQDVTKSLDNINKVGSVHFHVSHGSVSFRAKNFRPTNELYLYAPRIFNNEHDLNYIPFSPWRVDELGPIESFTESERKILYNLPFARRGYVFKNASIQKCYAVQEWYSPDPAAKADPKSLSKDEQLWLQKLQRLTKSK